MGDPRYSKPSMAWDWRLPGRQRAKSAVLKSVMRRLRIAELGFAEDGYQDLLTRGGLDDDVQ